MVGKSSVALIKEFFGFGRDVTMEELRALPAEKRASLAAAIAKQKGLEAKTVNGQTTYVPSESDG